MRWWWAPSKSYTTCYLNFIQYSANYALILTRYYAWSLITDEIHLIPDIHSYKINITFHAFHLHTWYNARWFTRHDTWTSWFCSQNFLIKKIFRWSYVITWRVNLLLSRLFFFFCPSVNTFNYFSAMLHLFPSTRWLFIYSNHRYSSIL